ncbi:helix-turn-helix domain-containing protein [Marinobacterium jannaschii]|uniref:helix-turn-helix domain-containing protein n=1 Tax=Marinobacterium jannaschii TaxID=64970 RepID=UPI0006881411|nr:XRE family transcriptional regulator [Marinobacterium jannaschii]
MPQSNTPNLGAAIKQRRKELGLNLAQLAETSSVSRSMLSEIERDNANPTFTSLWNITRALGLTIDELTARCVETIDLSIEHQSAQSTPRMLSDDEGCELRALNPVATATEFEWYELLIQPGSALQSDAHNRGTHEHLSVISGQLSVILQEQVESSARAGETLRYAADVQHEIRNPGDTVAQAFLVVHRPAALRG